jgi:hypothetical protein
MPPKIADRQIALSRRLIEEVRQSRNELRQQIELSMEIVNRSRQIIARIEDDWLAMFERR